MTANQFQALCGEMLVDPALALENEDIREALRNRDDEQVKELLETEF